jgi:uncharacterized protein (TIGR00725 family)
MSGIYSLDRSTGTLFDDASRRFDPATRTWHALGAEAGILGAVEKINALAAVTWLQRESGFPLRVPVGVIGPREAAAAQLATARTVGELLAASGLVTLCGGREGVMQAVCEGVARKGGVSIGLLPDTEPSLANRFVTIALATGIGEARNALVARASLCLIAIGNSFGTLSEIAFGRQFGKLVIGLDGAPDVSGVRHVTDACDAVTLVAELLLGAGRMEGATE